MMIYILCFFFFCNFVVCLYIFRCWFMQLYELQLFKHLHSIPLCYCGLFCLMSPFLLDIVGCIFFFHFKQCHTLSIYDYIYLPDYLLRVKRCNVGFELFPCHVCIESQGQRFILHYEANFSYSVFHLYLSLWCGFGGSLLSFRTFLLNS